MSEQKIIETKCEISQTQTKWKNGNYRIMIDSRLEDISGNNLQNLLDHVKTDDEIISKTHQYIKFKI